MQKSIKKDKIMENEKIKVYIKVNEKNEITEMTSSIFLKDTTGWIEIDEGFGDRFAHAQNQYFPGGLVDDDGNYKYKRSDV